MHLKKASSELVFDLINRDNEHRFLSRDFTFNVPQPSGDPQRNTQLLLYGQQHAGVGYTDEVTVFYNRLDLAAAMPPLEPEGVVVMVPNDGFVEAAEITDRLNRMYNLALDSSDIQDETLSITEYPASYTLRAHPESLAWQGEVVLQIYPDRPMFEDTFESTVLDGFNPPPRSSAGLLEPVVLFDQVIGLRQDDELLYRHAGQALMPDGFIVSHNGELTIGLSPRIGEFTSGRLINGNGYDLPIGPGESWAMVLSLHCLDASSDVPNLIASYECLLEITDASSQTRTLRLVLEDGALVWEVPTAGGPVFATTGITLHDGHSYQGLLDMTALLPQMGLPTLGSYRIRFQARRLNSIAPRLITSFFINATPQLEPVTRRPDEFNNLQVWLDFTAAEQLSTSLAQSIPPTKHQSIVAVQNRADGNFFQGSGDIAWVPGLGGRGGYTHWGGLSAAQLTGRRMREYFSGDAKTWLVVGRFHGRSSLGGLIFMRDIDGWSTFEVDQDIISHRNWTEYNDASRLEVGPVANGLPLAFAVRQNGEQMVATVNGVTGSSVPTSATGEMESQLRILNNAAALQFELMHVVAFSRYLNGGEINDLMRWAATQHFQGDYVEAIPTAYAISASYSPSANPTVAKLRAGVPPI